jgi:hypothetical protein
MERFILLLCLMFASLMLTNQVLAANSNAQPVSPNLSKLSSGSNYKALGDKLCDVHLEISKQGAKATIVTTFVAGDPRSDRGYCPYRGTTWIYEYSEDANIYESEAMVEFQPLSDGSFVLRYIPVDNGTRIIDVKFVQQ